MRRQDTTFLGFCASSPFPYISAYQSLAEPAVAHRAAKVAIRPVRMRQAVQYLAYIARFFDEKLHSKKVLDKQGYPGESNFPVGDAYKDNFFSTRKQTLTNVNHN